MPPSPIQCPHCRAPATNAFYCPACNGIFPPVLSNYFDWLGLEQTYHLDENKLVSAFRSLARRIHPDRFTGADEKTSELATSLSAQLNEAVRVLKDPVLRANYMLDLANGPTAIEIRDVPGDLLMEVMMMREQIEEAKASGDEATKDSLREAIQNLREQTLSQIAADADSLASADPSQKTEFRKLLNSMRYFDNLLKELATDPLAATGGAHHA